MDRDDYIKEFLEEYQEDLECTICDRTIRQAFVSFVKFSNGIYPICIDCYRQYDEKHNQELLTYLINRIEEETDYYLSQPHKYRLKQLLKRFGYTLLEEAISIGLYQYFRYKNMDSLNEMIYKLGGICYNLSTGNVVENHSHDSNMYCPEKKSEQNVPDEDKQMRNELDEIYEELNENQYEEEE